MTMMFLGVLFGCTLIFLAPSGRAELSVVTQGLYETATVLVTLPSKAPTDIEGKLFVKGPNLPNAQRSDGFVEAFPFTLIDRHTLSTSLFHLSPNHEYQLRIEIEGYQSIMRTVRTMAEFSMPPMSCDVRLQSGQSIQNAIDRLIAHAGKRMVQICLEPGVYEPFKVKDIVAQHTVPFIIRATDLNNKPIIDGGNFTKRLIDLERSANVWFDGLQLQGMSPGGAKGGFGYRADTCRGIVIRNNVIAGDGRWGILMNRSFQFPEGHGVEQDINLIEMNAITGLYNSMQFDNNDVERGHAVGMGLVIRGNTVQGGYDNFRHCGDEDAGKRLSERVKHYYRLTGSSGTQSAVNIDVYDNIIADAMDDNVEVDGVCSNYKFFRNRITGKARNVLSTAPLMPGPNFFIGNVFANVNPKQGFVKMNTSQRDAPTAASRNAFFYHNTMVREGKGPVLNLWWGRDAHKIPIKGFEFKNNIMVTRGKGVVTDVSIGQYHIEHPTFDYNRWHSLRPRGVLYEWWDGKDREAYDTFGAFVAGTGQSQHGSFGDPALNRALLPDKGSPVIDGGVILPGIGWHFLGKGPDIGASDIFHAAKRLQPPPPAVKPEPEQPVTGLPARVNRKNEPTLFIEIDKPRRAKSAILVLTVYDGEVAEEGKIRINGKGPVMLFGDQARGSNDGQVVRFEFETNPSWWVSGRNELQVEHVATNGFIIHAIEVKFSE